LPLAGGGRAAPPPDDGRLVDRPAVAVLVGRLGVVDRLAVEVEDVEEVVISNRAFPTSDLVTVWMAVAKSEVTRPPCPGSGVGEDAGAAV
jgi:hypothetical protein